MQKGEGEREGGLEKRESEETPLPFSLSPYPLPLSTPATQATKKPSIKRVIARYVFLVYVATLYMNYPRSGDCAFSASFVRECTDVSYLRCWREGV